MHKRYGFELVENEPDFKAFSTKSQNLEECWITLSHNKEELEMRMITDTYLQYCDADKWYKNIWEKIKLCYKIVTNQKVRSESEFMFRGRNHIEDFADMITLLSKEVLKETNELIQTREKLRRK